MDFPTHTVFLHIIFHYTAIDRLELMAIGIITRGITTFQCRKILLDERNSSAEETLFFQASAFKRSLYFCFTRDCRKKKKIPSANCSGLILGLWCQDDSFLFKMGFI